MTFTPAFLTNEELELLTGYQPNQRKRMCAWLKRNGIPYTENRLGEPVVTREAVTGAAAPTTEPNLEWLNEPKKKPA